MTRKTNTILIVVGIAAAILGFALLPWFIESRSTLASLSLAACGIVFILCFWIYGLVARWAGILMRNSQQVGGKFNTANPTEQPTTKALQKAQEKEEAAMKLFISLGIYVDDPKGEAE